MLNNEINNEMDQEIRKLRQEFIIDWKRTDLAFYEDKYALIELAEYNNVIYCISVMFDDIFFNNESEEYTFFYNNISQLYNYMLDEDYNVMLNLLIELIYDFILSATRLELYEVANNLTIMNEYIEDIF